MMPSIFDDKNSIFSGGLRDRPSLPDVVNPSQQNHQDPPMYPHRDPDGKIPRQPTNLESVIKSIL